MGKNMTSDELSVIMSHCGARELCMASRTCKRLAEAVAEEGLWSRVFHEANLRWRGEGWGLENQATEAPASWQEACRKLLGTSVEWREVYVSDMDSLRVALAEESDAHQTSSQSQGGRGGGVRIILAPGRYCCTAPIVVGCKNKVAVCCTGGRAVLAADDSDPSMWEEGVGLITVGPGGDFTGIGLILESGRTAAAATAVVVQGMARSVPEFILWATLQNLFHPVMGSFCVDKTWRRGHPWCILGHLIRTVVSRWCVRLMYCPHVFRLS